MILVIGSREDTVTSAVIAEIRRRALSVRVLDEVEAERYAIHHEGAHTFRIIGDGCDGGQPVTVVFLRHAPVIGTQHQMLAMGALQRSIHIMLRSGRCPSINPPANALSNYSKPYQVGLLASAGFDVPRSLVTNSPQAARRFFDELDERVIYKGVSNVPTLARVLERDALPLLDKLPACPTLFQEYVAGVDYRVHVVHERTFVTRLSGPDEDYRRSARAGDTRVEVTAATLPDALLERCVSFTRQLGLVMGGLDFKQSADGRLVALELNPYPQFTFYARKSGQPITEAVVDELEQMMTHDTKLYA